MTNSGINHSVGEAAAILRVRIMRARLLGDLLTALVYVLPFAAVAVLALRFLGVSWPIPWTVLASAGVVVVFFLILAVISSSKPPSLKACVAAIDSASSAGGLMMTDAAIAGWDYPEVVLPAIKRDFGRQTGLALGAMLLFVSVLALPNSLFARTRQSPKPVLAPLAEKELERLGELADEGLVDEDSAAEMKEWLEKAAAEDGASDSVNELLESIDHVAEQLDAAEAKGVSDAVGESEALAAAETMSEVLHMALESGVDESAVYKAAEAMRDFIAGSALSEALKSNILASAMSGAISAAELQKMAEALAACSNISSNKIMKLCESGRLSQAQCGNCCGACTNSAAARLAELAGKADACGQSAAAIGETLQIGGGAAPTRGYGAAELTFGKESDAGDAAFKDEVLSPYYNPDGKDARLQRVILTDPSAPDGPSSVKQGVLKGNGDSGGKTRRDSVLPRHRKAVEKYFDDN